MLYKNLAHSLKDVDKKTGVVCFYGSSFNVEDDGADMVVPGAYTKTLAQQGPLSAQPRIKFLYQHDATQLLGVPQVLKEDGFGLYVEAKIANTSLGRDVLTLYEEGVITEHSIGYETVVAEWDRTKGVRLLRELKLYEVSAVTWGMNSETPTVGVKSLVDPSHLTVLATKASTIDRLLHGGDLRCDALCEMLERDLKALRVATASAVVAEQARPYDLRKALDGLDSLMSAKAATQADKDAQEARSKKYGIGVKDGGSVTKPSAYADLSDDEFADPVNYSYPLDTKAHADNAASRFGDPDNRAVYTKAEQGIIDKRIAAAQKKFGEDSNDDGDGDNGKGATAAMRTRLIVKGTGGDLAVSATGSHAAYTGTHTHSHKAYKSQGDDSMHNEEHSHDGDANHDHHGGGGKSAHSHEHKQVAPNGRPVRKAARDFGTLFASLNESDQLQDDWGDTFIAFVQCAEELMWQSCAQSNGWVPEGSATVDIAAAMQDNLDAFGTAVNDLVTRSIAADFVPQLTCDRDQFIDPDGANAESDDDDDDDDDDDEWGDPRAAAASTKAPHAMPEAPARLAKVGRPISSANRAVITGALDGMSKAMSDLGMHHKAIADLMVKTDPDAVRQDEDDTQGDDDTENEGTNVNKQSSSSTSRRTAAEHPSHAGTTPDPVFAALDADLSAIKSRRAARA